MAHLHCAPAGANGPIVATLLSAADLMAAEGVDFDGNAARGMVVINDPNDSLTNPACGIPVNNIASLYEAILQRRIYLNVHSVANVPGETRGQLFPDM